MADTHSKSFFGQKTGIIVSSPAKNVPYIFLRCLNRKEDGRGKNHRKMKEKQ